MMHNLLALRSCLRGYSARHAPDRCAGGGDHTVAVMRDFLKSGIA